MTGTPVSRETRINPSETLPAMYSKCIVSPLINTPMAMMASNGPVEEEETEGRDAKSAVELPRRSPAEPPLPADADWTWEAA